MLCMHRCGSWNTWVHDCQMSNYNLVTSLTRMYQTIRTSSAERNGYVVQHKASAIAKHRQWDQSGCWECRHNGYCLHGFQTGTGLSGQWHCAILSWPHSAFQSTLNSFTIYRVVSYITTRIALFIVTAMFLKPGRPGEHNHTNIQTLWHASDVNRRMKVNGCNTVWF